MIFYREPSCLFSMKSAISHANVKNQHSYYFVQWLLTLFHIRLFPLNFFRLSLFFKITLQYWHYFLHLIWQLTRFFNLVNQIASHSRFHKMTPISRMVMSCMQVVRKYQMLQANTSHELNCHRQALYKFCRFLFVHMQNREP